jgi:hypothetical protein
MNQYKPEVSDILKKAVDDLIREGFITHPSVDEAEELSEALKNVETCVRLSICANFMPNLVQYCGWTRKEVEVLIDEEDLPVKLVDSRIYKCGFRVVLKD